MLMAFAKNPLFTFAGNMAWLPKGNYRVRGQIGRLTAPFQLLI